MYICIKCFTNYIVTPKDLLDAVSVDSAIKHEMALEANIVYDLSKGNILNLGIWDYVSHQVVASPFKPIDYMDKIDVFAYKFLSNSNIPAKYLVAELKKDIASSETIDQVLKYVDWVCSEYAYGDYGSIEACIFAYGFDEDIFRHYEKVVQRFLYIGQSSC